ncbi:MAG: phosphatidate cytidylyltransferase [Devosia sp.]|nr:phosphatidate cytidylyltransferase [Devosia sp.]
MSSNGESGDKAPAGRRSWADLGPRLASAFVLLPLTIVALYFGGYLFAAAVGAVFAGAYREWEQMVTLKPLAPFGFFLVGVVFVAALVFPAGGALATLGVTAVGALAALAMRGPGMLWRVGGLLYFGLVVIAIMAMRGTDITGMLAGVFLGTVVWLTDTGAFFTGRQVGGEKLAPDISPGKTRSGALGGLALGTIARTILWHFITASPWWIGLLLAASMSILGQVGDLAESALKRRFRIKDSGDIIPGHGGLMDRLDSVTFGVLFLYVVGALHAGAGAVAAGFLNW